MANNTQKFIDLLYLMHKIQKRIDCYLFVFLVLAWELKLRVDPHHLSHGHPAGNQGPIRCRPDLPGRREGFVDHHGLLPQEHQHHYLLHAGGRGTSYYVAHENKKNLWVSEKKENKKINHYVRKNSRVK